MYRVKRKLIGSLGKDFVDKERLSEGGLGLQGHFDLNIEFQRVLNL